MYKKILFLFLLFITITACHKKYDRQAEAERIVTEWVGKTIQFPANMKFSVQGHDTALTDFADTPYKILIFTDSTGCTSCKLKLYEWQELMADSDSTLGDKLSFLFCFQPKNKSDLVFIFKRDRFQYPVFIDDTNQLNKLNHFPANDAYQCFLLDNSNKIISIGNPARNPKVWNLYKQIITGKIRNDTQQNTRVEVIDSVIQLDKAKVGIKQKMVYRIKNSGDSPLVISDVKTSCGCTNAEWEKKPVAAGKITEIKAEITLDHSGYFEKTITVYCNTEEQQIVLKIKGTTEI